MTSSVQIKNASGRFEAFDHTPDTLRASDASFVETAWDLPGELGGGWFRRIGFNSGIQMTLSHCRMAHPYQARMAFDRPLITIVFTLSGHTESQTSLVKKPLRFQQGESCFHYFPDSVITRKIDPGISLQAVVVKISPEHLRKMVGDHVPGLPKAVDAILRGNGDRPYFCSHKSSPAIQNTLCQILNPPHQGSIRHLYLESKAMELIAHKLDQIVGQAPSPKALGEFAPRDIEKIHEAGESVIRQMQDPPSLQALAREAGMSHTKLNRGFRLVFGCTVFAYLRWHRLEHAKQLLCRKGFNVTQVAHEAGFCSSSHFARAFSKRFSTSPRSFLKCREQGDALPVRSG